MLFWNFQIISTHVAKCIEKRCREITESKLNDTQCGFRHGRRTTDHISLSSQTLRNLRSMLKTSSHALSISRKHTTRLPVKSFGECCVQGRRNGGAFGGTAPLPFGRVGNGGTGALHMTVS